MLAGRQRQPCLALLWWVALLIPSPSDAIIRPPPDDSSQCIGATIDYSRLVPIHGLDYRDPQGEPLSFQQYSIRQVNEPPLGRSSSCRVGRARLQETSGGFPIYGANVVVTMKSGGPFCGGRSPHLGPKPEFNWEASDADQGRIMRSMLNDLQLSDVYGKTFRDVQVPMGRSLITPDEAMQAVADYFGITTRDVADVQPNLQIYISTEGDMLTYFVDDVLIPLPNSTAGMYRVIVDSTEPTILSVCTYVDPQSGLAVERRRRTRGQPSLPTQSRELQNTCSSCANQYSISLADLNGEISCPINSLYLDDTGKTTTCNSAFVSGAGFINVAGPVASLFFEGTYDCRNTFGPCVLTELPTCPDAISDIQFVCIQTLQYLRSNLNILGGLRPEATNPVPLLAFAHWRPSYCNAFL